MPSKAKVNKGRGPSPTVSGIRARRAQAVQNGLAVGLSHAAARRAAGVKGQPAVPQERLALPAGVVSAEELREDWRQHPGAGLGDVVTRLTTRAVACHKDNPDTANKSDELLCKVLGYLAPTQVQANVQVQHTGLIRQAVAVLHSLPLSASDLLRVVSQQPDTGKVQSQASVDSVQVNDKQ